MRCKVTIRKNGTILTEVIDSEGGTICSAVHGVPRADKRGTGPEPAADRQSDRAEHDLEGSRSRALSRPACWASANVTRPLASAFRFPGPPSPGLP